MTGPTQRRGMGIGRWFGSIAGRMGGAFFVFMLLIAAMAGIGIASVRSISQGFEEVLEHRLPRLDLLQALEGELASLNMAARDALIATDEATRNASLATIQSGRASIGEKIEVLQGYLEEEGSERAKNIQQTVTDHSSAILVGLVRFSRLMQAGRMEQAIAALTEGLRPQLEGLSGVIRDYRLAQMAELTELRDNSAARVNQIVVQSLVVALAGLLLAVLFAYLVIRSVTRPLVQAVDSARQMAQGNFTERIAVRNHDEVGQVLASFNTVSEGMATLMGNIKQRVEQVDQISGRLEGVNRQLSEAADSETDTLRNAETHMASVLSGLGETEAQARDALSLSTTMGNVAKGVEASVQASVQAMDRINHSSEKITEIISVIDSIAFQTNILALNAAVEAARAGEAGRGFAVVASEVRSLAKRSTDASREIKQLITATRQEVDNGVQKIESVNHSINSVIETASSMEGMVNTISNGTTRQSASLQQMAELLHTLSAENQRHMQMVEDMSLISEKLSHVSTALSRNAADFKTLDGAQPTSVPRLP